MRGFRRRVLGWIRRIPRGTVATYGQIAALAGAPRRARMVGQALGSLPAGSGSQAIPWHRVINAQGRVSPRGGETGARRGKHLPPQDGTAPETRQQRLLEAEGVRFRNGRIDLARYRWDPALSPRWEKSVAGGRRDDRV